MSVRRREHNIVNLREIQDVIGNYKAAVIAFGIWIVKLVQCNKTFFMQAMVWKSAKVRIKEAYKTF